jgi:flagellar protein FlgJ
MALNGADLTSRLALDAQSVDALRAQTKGDPDRALKSAAKQFEALFMSMLLKSMRDASPQDGPFDSEQTRMYTSMLDQQLAQSLSSRGVGLADIMVRQLTQGVPPAPRTAAPASTPALSPDGLPGAGDAAPLSAPSRSGNARTSDAVRDFMSKHAASAQAASEATGIPARFLLAQAGLESGWGRREIKAADGTDSNNLFGIKAGRNWNGRVVEAGTAEYLDGKAAKTVERFRAYENTAASFRDYANLIANSPRYSQVRHRKDEVAFAYGLQRAGYATDPRYADKLLRVMDSIKSRYSTMA